MGEPEITESPQSTTVLLNSAAIFICKARDYDSIYWFINGTSANSNQDIRIIDPTVDDDISMLTISGKTQYNGSQIQCRARDLDGPVQSENVTLYVQGEGAKSILILQREHHIFSACCSACTSYVGAFSVTCAHMCASMFHYNCGRHTWTSGRFKDQQ